MSPGGVIMASKGQREVEHAVVYTYMNGRDASRRYQYVIPSQAEC